MEAIASRLEAMLLVTRSSVFENWLHDLLRCCVRTGSIARHTASLDKSREVLEFFMKDKDWLISEYKRKGIRT